MIVVLLNVYLALLFILVKLKIVPFNLFWKVSPVIVLLLLLIGLFIPMNWGAPQGRGQKQFGCPGKWAEKVMTLIDQQASVRRPNVRLGFKTSIITLFVAIVLLIGLTLVYLSFSRITAITRSAAGKFIDKVAELSADRVGAQLKLVKDNLEILKALPPVQSATIENNPQLIELLAAMLKNNNQLFNLYVGYDDGSFIELDAIAAVGREGRARLEAPDNAVFRLVVISRSGPAGIKSRRLFLSDKLAIVREVPGPLHYDPRKRPWYEAAQRPDGNWLTGPYIFFATGKHGYTIHVAMEQGKRGVVAGDLLLDVTEAALQKERLTSSGVAFLFDDDNRILAHPKMSELLGREVSGLGDASIPRLRENDMAGVLKAIRTWRSSGVAEQFFYDPTGRLYAAAFRTIPNSGLANLRIAVVAPVDEFFASIIEERGRLFAATLAFVLMMLPVVYFIGALLSKSLQALSRRIESRGFNRRLRLRCDRRSGKSMS